MVPPPPSPTASANSTQLDLTPTQEHAIHRLYAKVTELKTLHDTIDALKSRLRGCEKELDELMLEFGEACGISREVSKAHSRGFAAGYKGGEKDGEGNEAERKNDEDGADEGGPEPAGKVESLLGVDEDEAEAKGKVMGMRAKKLVATGKYQSGLTGEALDAVIYGGEDDLETGR